VVQEFAFKGPFLKLAQNIGLLVGAAFWGLASDVWGRRWAFNLTLLIIGVFATAAGGAPNATTLCAMAALWSVGVGGNLPVDSAVFLGQYYTRLVGYRRADCAYRVCPCYAPVSAHSALYLVGVRPANWLTRQSTIHPVVICTDVRLDCLASHCELLLRSDSSPMSTQPKPRLALLHLHDGRHHAPMLGSPFLRLQALRVAQVPHWPWS
jgi:hypothetical protein